MVRPSVFFVCTGAGASVTTRVWETPGCSEYFEGSAFPYSTAQTDDFLGFSPDSYCSEDTALALAMAAYQRAWSWPKSRAIGVAITASVASSQPHRGEHRVHGAAMTEAGCWSITINLAKGSGIRQRLADEEVAAALAIDLWEMAEEGRSEPNATARARELFFRRPFIAATGKRTGSGFALVYMPGAFNPPHASHFQAALAGYHVGKHERATFWVDATAPNKPELPLFDLCRRAKMLDGYDVLFTDDAPLYIDKARKAPGASFILGADALKRMLDPKWGPEVKPMLHEMSALGTTFLVLDRGTDKAFDILLDAGIPVELQGMFRSVGRTGDESSTLLRAQAGL